MSLQGDAPELEDHKAFLEDFSPDGEGEAYQTVFRTLDRLRAVPARDPQAKAAQRSAFLAQAQSFKEAVSPRRGRRLKGWTETVHKERSPMKVLLRTGLALTVALVGTVTTALASQDSLPQQALYPVKLITEDLRLAMTSEPQQEFDLLVGFAGERTHEMATLAQGGQDVPLDVALRLEQHLRLALQEASRLQNPELNLALERILLMAQAELQILKGAQPQPDGNFSTGAPALQMAEQSWTQAAIDAGAPPPPETCCPAGPGAGPGGNEGQPQPPGGEPHGPAQPGG